MNITLGEKPIPITWLRFSDGAITCKLDTTQLDKYKNENGGFTGVSATINMSIKDTPVCEVIERLNLVVDAMRLSKVYPTSLHLIMDYLPYGRADRVFEEGNPNPLRLFIKQLSKLVDSITVEDPHNPRAYADYCSEFGICCLQHLPYPQLAKQWDYLICPDKGAKVRVYNLQDKIQKDTGRLIPIVIADKVRDVTTGWIVDTILDVDETLLTNTNVLILDDICDGGGTFIPLANKLREKGANLVGLYVTHGIFSKGLQVFKNHIDLLSTKNIVGNYVTKNDINIFNKGEPI